MLAKQKQKQKQQMVENGLIHVDENGCETLTPRGWDIVASRIGSLPVGEEILIELAVLESREIASYAY